MTKMDLIRNHLYFQLNNALCLLLEPSGDMEIGWCCSEAAFYSSGLRALGSAGVAESWQKPARYPCSGIVEKMRKSVGYKGEVSGRI